MALISGSLYKYTLFIIISITFLFTTLFLLWDEKHNVNLDSITFFDVGQGDAILLTSNSECLLVDGGPNFEILSKLLKYCGLFKCDLHRVVSTHAHADHLNGILRVLQYCTYDIFNSNFDIINKMDVSPLLKHDKFIFGKFIVYVLWPPKIYNGNINDLSIVLLIDYLDKEILLTGDIGAKIFDQIKFEDYKYIIDGELDILKVSHHGSLDSFNEKVLQNLDIKNAVISVGKNSYGHPSSYYLEFFENNHVNLYRTDEFGDVTFVL